MSNKETQAIAVALVALLIGLFVSWVVTDVFGWEDPGSALFALILLPLLMYMVVSGRVEELSGPGGFEAKFTRFADERVESEIDVIDESVAQIEAVTKGGLGALPQTMERLDSSKPYNLELRVGQTHFTADALARYLDQLAYSPAFKFVLLVDGNGRLIAYGPHWRISQILRDPDQADEFVTLLNEPDVERLKRHPALRTEALPVGTRNLEALQAMAEARVEALVVTDTAGRPIGLAERDQLVPKMLLALSKPR